MRLDDQRASSNVQDRRGSGAVKGGAAVGVGGIVLTLVIGFMTGKSPIEMFQMIQGSGGGGGQASGAAEPRELSAEEERQGVFIAQVLGSTEDIWNEQYPVQFDSPYEEPQLILFSNEVSSACGFQTAATGPFYCPGDHQVYMDTTFFAELDRRFEAPGDFARAYVVAHEVGHHIQTISGLSGEFQRLKRGRSAAEQNEFSVRQELQADCYAGVWAHYAHNEYSLLEAGDVQEGLNAANQIGDDNIQLRTQGTTRPHTYTHGTGEQRMRWFQRGFESGQSSRCDTIAARSL